MPTQPFHVSAKVVVRDSEGRRLVLKRARASRGNPGRWEFPGGKVDPAERIDEALLREVKEETGIKIELEKVIGSAESEARGKRIAYIFFDARHLFGKVRIGKEHEAYRWLTLEELLALKGLAAQFQGFTRSYCRAHGHSPHKPASKPQRLSLKDLRRHVRDYVRVLPHYRRFAKILRRVLEDGVKRISPLALVQARPKSVASFAEKILRKNKYSDPLRQITDLCGARVVTQIKPEADAVCRFIRESFMIDEANSHDAFSKLRPGEFGYRSVHYVVEFKGGVFPGIPKNLFELKAEIQVRTILQHAWSDVGHDRIYKSGFKVPESCQREAARVAAILENADDRFAQIVAGLEEYHCEFGAYLEPDKLEGEIAILKTRLRHDRRDVDAVHRLARIAMAQGDWQQVVRLVERLPERLRTGQLLCCLGSALCEQHKRSRSSSGFRRGRGLFREATRINTSRSEAYWQLAETASNKKEQLRHFQKAFEVDPGNPAALAGYIRLRILLEQSAGFVPLLRPEIEEAIEKCRLHVQAGVNIPWAFYRMAGFHLLLGPEHEREALTACAHGVRRTTSPDLLDSAIGAAEMLAGVLPERTDVKCVMRFLVAARQAKFPTADHAGALRRLATKRCSKLQEPIIIVAGACDPAKGAEMAGYRDLLHAALADFKGTIVSGGTRQGISGLVGELGRRARDRIFTVGYLPSPPPRDGSASIDHRYRELRWTDGKDKFSVVEPVQNWIDLVASGVSPAEVRLIGINGGPIAALEYRLAWAMGARVGVVRDSGREADVLEMEIKENEFEGMVVFPPDAMTLRAFIHMSARGASPLSAIQRERLARIMQARYLEEGRHKLGDRTMREWEYLDEDIKDSNREQVAYMPQILEATGYTIAPASDGKLPVKFSTEELEIMGKMEHGRWNVERLRQGWHYAKERDPEKRLSPYLVPWDALDKRTKDWDRQAMNKFAELLAEIGMQIVPTPKGPGRRL